MSKNSLPAGWVPSLARNPASFPSEPSSGAPHPPPSRRSHRPSLGCLSRRRSWRHSCSPIKTRNKLNFGIFWFYEVFQRNQRFHLLFEFLLVKFVLLDDLDAVGLAGFLADADFDESELAFRKLRISLFWCFWGSSAGDWGREGLLTDGVVLNFVVILFEVIFSNEGAIFHFFTISTFLVLIVIRWISGRVPICWAHNTWFNIHLNQFFAKKLS